MGSHNIQSKEFKKSDQARDLVNKQAWIYSAKNLP